MSRSRFQFCKPKEEEKEQDHAVDGKISSEHHPCNWYRVMDDP
jgi:hypothetical protein